MRDSCARVEEHVYNKVSEGWRVGRLHRFWNKVFLGQSSCSKVQFRSEINSGQRVSAKNKAKKNQGLTKVISGHIHDTYPDHNPNLSPDPQLRSKAQPPAPPPNPAQLRFRSLQPGPEARPRTPGNLIPTRLSPVPRPRLLALCPGPVTTQSPHPGPGPRPRRPAPHPGLPLTRSPAPYTPKPRTFRPRTLAPAPRPHRILLGAQPTRHLAFT